MRRLCRAPTEGYWQIVCDRHPRTAGAGAVTYLLAVRQDNNSKNRRKKVFRRRAEHNAPKRQGGLCTACLKRAIFNKITDSTPRSVRRLCRAPTEGYWQIVCDRHPRTAGAGAVTYLLAVRQSNNSITSRKVNPCAKSGRERSGFSIRIHAD